MDYISKSLNYFRSEALKHKCDIMEKASERKSPIGATHYFNLTIEKHKHAYVYPTYGT